MKFKKHFFIVIIMLFSVLFMPVSVLAKDSVILICALSDINANTAKKNDIYRFKTLDNLNLDNQTFIKKGSIIEGKVIKSRPITLLRTDAYIDILITGILTDSGLINLENNNIKLRITDYRYKTAVRRVLQRTPVYIASYGVSIPLGTASYLSGGVIFAITVGAAAAAGFLSGLVDPDYGTSRMEGATIRGMEGTPLGTFLVLLQKGYDVNCNGVCILAVRFDNKTKQKLASTLNKQIISTR